MTTLQTLASKHGYDLRSVREPLKVTESFGLAISVFNFSEKHGGAYNAFKFYNDYYLYPIKV